jgi:hypothetical protein
MAANLAPISSLVGEAAAALLAIARALKVCPPVEGWHADLMLVANVGKEGEGNLSGMPHLRKQSPSTWRESR